MSIITKKLRCNQRTITDTFCINPEQARWKGLPYLIQCIPFKQFAYPYFGAKRPNCVKHYECRGKSLFYLIQLSRKRQTIPFSNGTVLLLNSRIINMSHKYWSTINISNDIDERLIEFHIKSVIFHWGGSSTGSKRRHCNAFND